MKLDMEYSILVPAILIGALIIANLGCLVSSYSAPSPPQSIEIPVRTVPLRGNIYSALLISQAYFLYQANTLQKQKRGEI